MAKLEFVLPRYEKCFFWIPLREALLVWGIIQTMVVTSITVQAVCSYSSRIVHIGDKVTPTAMLAVAILFAVLDNTFNLMLTWNVKQSNCVRLNWCYNYYACKVCVYAGLLGLSVVMATCCYSHNWYYYNLDPWRYYLLRDNLALGLLDCLLQCHLALLVRSYLLQLGGEPRCVFQKQPAPRVSDCKAFVVPAEMPADNNHSYDKQALYAVE